MNCIEFRRRKLSTPKALGAQADAHALSCRSCAELGQQVDALEAQLAAALQTPVPEGLADRVLLRQKLRSARHRWYFAVAATLVMALGVWFRFDALQGNLADQATAHVASEPKALATNDSIRAQMIASAFARAGGRLDKPIGTVSYLDRCPMPGGIGEHLVLQTEFGKVSVMLMPGAGLNAPLVSNRNGFIALVMPAGKGSYAVVGTSNDGVRRIAAVLNESVRWDNGG